MAASKFFKIIRADERTALLPVVIMTSSQQQSELLSGYRNGANSYVVKPVNFDEFSERIKDLGRYWTSTNTQPSRQEPAHVSRPYRYIGEVHDVYRSEMTTLTEFG